MRITGLYMIHKNKRLSQIDFEFSLFLFVYNIPRISKPFFRPLAVGILTG